MALIAHTHFAGPGAVSSPGIDTSGSTLLIAALASGTGMQDSYANAWTPLPGQGSGASGSVGFFYVLSPIVGSGHTFQDVGNNFSSAVILAFDTVTTFDSQTGASSVSSPAQGGSLTPANANNLMVAAIGGGNDGSSLIDSGYTKSEEVAYAGGVNYGSAIAWLAQASATAQNPTWTDSFAFPVGVVNATFTTSGPPPPAAAYCYRRTLTVDHTQCGTADSTDFPVVARLSDATFKTVANGGHVQHTTTSNGQTVPADLNFYSDLALTTPLAYETESYDATTGDLVCWVKLPTLSHTADTVFYMAYGDAGTTTFQGNVNGTWNSNFKGVWHLPNGTTLAANDSTSGLHTGAITGPTAAGGNIDGGASFNGSTDQISLGASADWNFSGAFSVLIWFNTTTSSVGAWLIGAKSIGATSGFFLNINSSGNLIFTVRGAFTAFDLGTAYNDGNWHRAVGTYAPTGIVSIYADGTFKNTNTLGSASLSASDPLTMGIDNTSLFPVALVGLLDEGQVVNALLSDDWILSDYNNQKPASTFLTLSGETFLCGNAVKSSGIRGWSWGF